MGRLQDNAHIIGLMMAGWLPAETPARASPKTEHGTRNGKPISRHRRKAGRGVGGYTMRATRKDIYNGAARVVRVGYCGAQNLLCGVDAFASNAGVYGWNWSAYNVGGGVVICTGYRNLTGDVMRETVKKYDEQAREARALTDWREREKRLNGIRAAFVREVLNA